MGESSCTWKSDVQLPLIDGFFHNTRTDTVDSALRCETHQIGLDGRICVQMKRHYVYACDIK